jgi:hypothetical protein
MPLIEAALELLSVFAGFGVLYLLSGRKMKLNTNHKLPWWGFKRLPNGEIIVEWEAAAFFGLMLLAIGFVAYVKLIK